MFYDGFLIYASTQEILCKSIKKLRLKAPTDILEPKEGEILKIDRSGRITTGAFAPRTSFEHWWRKYPFYRSYYEDTPTSYDDLFSVAKAFGVTADEVQALLDYGCSKEEIEEMLYDLTLLHEMTGELLYAYWWKEVLRMIALGPIFQAVGAVVDLIIEAVENFSDSWGGEKMNAGKVILGALTIIGLLADIIDDDWTQKYRLIKSRYFLSVSLGYTYMK